MGPLSRLWKGLQDVRNESSETVEVPADTFAKLIEQSALLLGQASLSISYTRRLNILKALLKDPRKAKALLKEKTVLLQESQNHLFCKKSHSHIIEVERSKKQSLKAFKGSNEKNTPFRKGLLSYQNRPQGGGRYYYTEKSNNRDQNKNIRFQNNASASARKFHHAGSASNSKYFFCNSRGGSCHQQSRTGSTDKDFNSRACTSKNKEIIYKKHSRCTISRKTTLLHNSLRKNYLGSRNIIIVKGYEIPFVSLSFQKKIPNLTKMSKEQFSLVEQELLEMLEKGAIQK